MIYTHFDGEFLITSSSIFQTSMLLWITDLCNVLGNAEEKWESDQFESIFDGETYTKKSNLSSLHAVSPTIAISWLLCVVSYFLRTFFCPDNFGFLNSKFRCWWSVANDGMHRLRDTHLRLDRVQCPEVAIYKICCIHLKMDGWWCEIVIVRSNWQFSVFMEICQSKK